MDGLSTKTLEIIRLAKNKIQNTSKFPFVETAAKENDVEVFRSRVNRSLREVPLVSKAILFFFISLKNLYLPNIVDLFGRPGKCPRKRP